MDVDNNSGNGMLEDEAMDSEKEALDFMGMNEDEKETPKEESDEKDETTEETSEEETEEKPESLLTKYGLDSQYRDEEDVFARAKEQNKYLTQLEQKNAELTKALQGNTPQNNQPLRKEISDDDFLENPIESLKNMGYITRAESEKNAQAAANNAIEQNRTERFISETADYSEHEDAMKEMYAKMPSLDYMPRNEAIELLYQAAKGQALSRNLSKSSSSKADLDKKSRANTSGGRAEEKAKEYTQKDYDSMSLGQLEELFPEK